MNLEAIHNTVRKALARGDTLDDSIPRMVKQAARWIERNQSYKHMERFRCKVPSQDDGKLLELPSRLVKNIRFMRMVTSRGYVYIPRADPQDIRQRGMAGQPTAYWRHSPQYLILDSDAAGAEIEIGWYEYTDWPIVERETNWLIENAFDALVAQTMIFFAGELLAPKLRQLYEPQRTEALRTLNIAHDEEEFSDTDSVMRFS